MILDPAAVSVSIETDGEVSLRVHLRSESREWCFFLPLNSRARDLANRLGFWKRRCTFRLGDDRVLLRPGDFLCEVVWGRGPLIVTLEEEVACSIMFEGVVQTVSVPATATVGDIHSRAIALFELDPATKWVLSGAPALDATLSEFPDTMFELIEPVVIRIHSRTEFREIDASPHTLARDVVRGHRLGLLCGLALPPSAPIKDLASRYGPDFFLIDDDAIVAIDVTWDCESARFPVDRRATVRNLKEIWAIETGNRDAEVIFVDRDGDLPWEKPLGECNGPLMCRDAGIPSPVSKGSGERLCKPLTYNEDLRRLMAETGIDRRMVSQCFGFHNYNYERALEDLRDN